MNVYFFGVFEYCLCCVFWGFVYFRMDNFVIWWILLVYIENWRNGFVVFLFLFLVCCLYWFVGYEFKVCVVFGMGRSGWVSMVLLCKSRGEWIWIVKDRIGFRMWRWNFFMWVCCGGLNNWLNIVFFFFVGYESLERCVWFKFIFVFVNRCDWSFYLMI